MVLLHLIGQPCRISGGPFDDYVPPAIGVCLERHSARAAQAQIRIDIPDFQAPTPAQLTQGLAEILTALHLQPGAELFIGCRAGIGRTGTIIAALANLAGHANPVAWTRRHYHPQAVETPAQHAAVDRLDTAAVWAAYRAKIQQEWPMYALYYFPNNASLLPHMVLRELGVPFELRLVDRTVGAHKSPDYLRLNPHGWIPVLIDGDLVLYETAAITLHLCDRHPEVGLAPPFGTGERAQFYKWMIYLTNTVQAELLINIYPDRHVADSAAIPSVKQKSAERLHGMFDRIAADLGDDPWLLGEHFSAADLFLFMLMRWTGRQPRPASQIPALAAHAARVLARPAVRATLEAEGIS